MERIIALLESAENHLAEAQKELDLAETEKAVEVLVSCQRMLERTEELESRLHKKALALLHSLQDTHLEIRRLNKRRIMVNVGKHHIEITASYFSVYSSKGDRMMPSMQRSEFKRWADEQGIFWDFCRKCASSIEAFLGQVAADTTLCDEINSFGEISRQVQNMSALLKT